MQISVETETGKVRQYGTSLGELAGCTVVELADEQAAVVLTLLDQIEGDGYVRSFPDGTFERVAASEEWVAAERARQDAIARRAADLAAVKAHVESLAADSPEALHLAALARLVGAL